LFFIPNLTEKVGNDFQDAGLLVHLGGLCGELVQHLTLLLYLIKKKHLMVIVSTMGHGANIYKYFSIVQTNLSIIFAMNWRK